MDREARRAKRQQETRFAAIGFAIVLVLAVVLAAGTVFGVRTMLHQNDVPVAAEPEPGLDNTLDTQSEPIEPAQQPTEEPLPAVPESDPELDAAMQKVTQMTLEERVAQLFFITPDALTGIKGTNIAGQTTKGIYDQYPVGGIIYMSINLQNPDQTRGMIKKMNEIAVERTGLPLLIGVDEEGGSVARIAGNGEFRVQNVGDMAAIGATGDANNAYQAGVSIGTYLKDLGFNVNFAPVADVLTNDANTVIGNRSFGSDAALVSEMVKSALGGLGEKGIVGAVKHFPGQGGTAGDSHEGAVVLEKSAQELHEVELVPFKGAIEAGAKIIMVSHMSLPNVTGDQTPASMSGAIMTDLLRGELNYKGVIMTDALNMGAITAGYNSQQAAVTAIAAGADMILMPEDFKAAYQGVLEAVGSGMLSEERVNDAAAHVIKLKNQLQQ